MMQPACASAIFTYAVIPTGPGDCAAYLRVYRPSKVVRHSPLASVDCQNCRTLPSALGVQVDVDWSGLVQVTLVLAFGGGMVEVTLSGKHEARWVKIDPALLVIVIKDRACILESLIDELSAVVNWVYVFPEHFQ